MTSAINSPSTFQGAAAGRPAVEEPNFSRAATRFFGDEDGQSMVEFALSGFLLFAMILLIVQMSFNANAANYTQLGNFYALRTASVSWEYSELNFAGYTDLEGDMIAQARYWTMPIWYNQGDLPLTFFASGMIPVGIGNVGSAVGVDADDLATNQDGNFFESSLGFNYAMTIPIARNIVGASWVGANGYNINEDFLGSSHRGSMHGQSGIFMVKDQMFLTGALMNEINATFADIGLPVSLGAGTIGGQDDVGSLGKLVTLQLRSDSRQPVDMNGNPGYNDSTGTTNGPNMHRMIIHQRRF
jgi:hypothetical protein